MIRTLPLVLASAALAAPAAAAERSYSVTDFDRISVEGPYVVRLTIGRSTTARATGPQASIERILVDSQGQTLRIRPNRAAWGGNDGAQQGVVELNLTTRALRSARIIGPGRLDIIGAGGLRVDLNVEGSGRLTATGLAADNLSLGVRGSGRIEAAGRAHTLSAAVDGSGDLAAPNLTSDDATLTATTTGAVVLGPARSARITANGLGAVTVAGRPACTVNGAGAAQVRCGSDQRQPR
jgi:hypothetical protein